MKIKLKSRLELVMKDAGISTFEEMAKRMEDNQGWSITRSALSRKFRDENVSLTLQQLEAICNELQCLPGDLYETTITDATPEDVDDLQNRLFPFRHGMVKTRGAKPEPAPAETKATSRKQEAAAEEKRYAKFGPAVVTHLSERKVTERSKKKGKPGS